MLISLVIILISLLCFVRTLGFGIQSIKEKNILGGASVFFLSLLVLASLYFTI